MNRWLARFLNQPISNYRHFSPEKKERLERVLRPGDVLLVEGDRRISVAIKYLTQSTWSHACMYVGNALGDGEPEKRVLVEADIVEGVIGVPLETYLNLNMRICRPVGLSDAEIQELVSFVVSRLGQSYDTSNVFDLLRYLLPTPPVPARFRRRMLKLGSGDPSRYICSTLLGQAFQHLNYPVLPRRAKSRNNNGESSMTDQDILVRRHYSFFTPRDFDLSPYFRVVKPTLESTFDHRALMWVKEPEIEGR